MSALIKIESMESCPEDGIPCECKAVTLRIVAPVVDTIVADTAVEIKSWKTYFARLFPTLSCTSEAAVAVTIK